MSPELSEGHTECTFKVSLYLGDPKVVRAFMVWTNKSLGGPSAMSNIMSNKGHIMAEVHES